MECDENGGECTVPASTSCRPFKRKRGPCSQSSVQLALTLAVPGASGARPMYLHLVPDCEANLPLTATDVQPTSYPFMSNMDEISYWIFTKRAPCLLNYDNIIKNQVEHTPTQAHCSKTKPASVKSKSEVVVSPKKKRKLKLMDDDSVSSEKQQNIYFELSNNQNEKTAQSICKSETVVSDIGFNIKKAPVQNKAKRIKLQKSFQNSMHKKTKLVTSTPKVNLRRSLRKTQQNNNNSHINNSFDIFNSSIVNGKKALNQEIRNKSEKSNQQDQNQIKAKLPEKGRNELNGQFEDLSDVSGFTANYIRSTKLYSSKTPRKLRSRHRSVIKNSKSTIQSDKMIMCVNKSVNTGCNDAAALNCSTDSSQNVLNLVTVRNNDRSGRINKSTSLLKFVEANYSKGNVSNNKSGEQDAKNNLNLSFQSRSSGVSRYPRRNTNKGNLEQNCSSVNISNTNSPNKRYNMRRNQATYLNETKQSDDMIVSKTRSGRKIGLNLDMVRSSCTILNTNDSSEPVSTNVTFNVAHPNEGEKNNSTSRCLRSRRVKSEQVCKDTTSNRSVKRDVDGARGALVQSVPKCVKRAKKSIDKIGQSLSRVSLRDKSGFAACFSDSDNETEPLKEQKFFC